MKRLNRTVVLRRLMEAWANHRQPAEELFMVPIQSIQQTFPIRVVERGQVEDGTFTYTNNLN